MSEYKTLDCLFELYGLYSELVIHLESISKVSPIEDYLGFRREMKDLILSQIVSRGVLVDEIPKFYFDYDRSRNSLKLESLICKLHKECLYYCEKFSSGVYSQHSLDCIAVGEFHRNMISVLNVRIEDLFILDEIEEGKSETEAREQWATCQAFIQKLVDASRVS